MKTEELTMRDLFAMHIMSGMLASHTGSDASGMERIAKTAYRRADWMLKARVCTPEELNRWDTHMGDGHKPKEV